MDSILCKVQPFFDGVLNACGKIAISEGTGITVSAESKPSAIPGCLYKISSGVRTYTFWLGVNGPRLFFIACVRSSSAYHASQTFKFCFEVAGTTGWRAHYEPIDENALKILANCMVERTEPFTALQDATPDHPESSRYELTDTGLFWVQDIAMMVQSWVRSCERAEIICSPHAPAP